MWAMITDKDYAFTKKEKDLIKKIRIVMNEDINDIFVQYKYGSYPISVGLSKGQAGNSEVGHMTIGAGRLLKQSEMLVNDFLKEPDMENANVIKLLENKDKDVHIMGLCSDGNIHAGVDDFLSMYKFLIDNGFTKIHFHLITDGRDTGVHDAMKYINMIKDIIIEYGVGDVVSICGSFSSTPSASSASLYPDISLTFFSANK